MQPFQKAREALDNFTTELQFLVEHGLSLKYAIVLHTTYVNGAITHLLRTQYVDAEFCMAWDDAICGFWTFVLQRELKDLPIPRTQMFFAKAVRRVRGPERGASSGSCICRGLRAKFCGSRSHARFHCCGAFCL